MALLVACWLGMCRRRQMGFHKAQWGGYIHAWGACKSPS
jgi:hypothetical protein